MTQPVKQVEIVIMKKRRELATGSPFQWIVVALSAKHAGRWETTIVRFIAGETCAFGSPITATATAAGRIRVV